MSEPPKSSLKNPQGVKRLAEPRRITFMSPKSTLPKQPRLLFGTSSPSNDRNKKQQMSTFSITSSSPIAGEEVFNQVVMLQMKAIGLRGENLWQIVDTGAKVKNAILQMSEEDHFLYQVDGRLNEYASKLEAKTQKIRDNADHVENVSNAAKQLREKFLALRSNT